MKTAYTYTLLRYIHDVASGEFANVGIVMLAPDCRFAGARCRKTHGRVSHFFPDMERKGFRSNLSHIEARIESLGDRLQNELSFEEIPMDAERLAKSILPHDDSSLQWTSLSGGLCENPSEKLDELYERYIDRYDEKSFNKGRDDSEVWKQFKSSLDSKQITARLSSKKITSADDEVEFEHAYKNSQWHCFEPLSLDLAQADSIKQKAHRWLGQMVGVQDSPDPFRVYFLVGAPRNKLLLDSYEGALKLLRKSPMGVEIIPESEADAFADRFAKIISAHESGAAEVE